ncbi:MAG: cyclic nucleotide-binding domain-containing protein [Pseudomonadota bacterium]
MGLTDWAFLVHLAALTQVAGYLIRDQLWLRLLLLIGTVFYGAYYYLFPAEPLWEAFYWALAMGAANAGMTLALLRDRMVFGIAGSQLDLFRRFSPMAPGEFRRLMQIGVHHAADAEMVLTREGQKPTHLYFVTSGSIEIEKGTWCIKSAAPSFIGEISLLTDSPASATVRVRSGVRYVSWEREALRKLLARRPLLRERFDGLINQDLALKVQERASA